MQLGNSTVSQIRTGNPDEGFQRLLLAISAAATRGERGETLIRSICSASRECFQAGGAYVWRRDVPGDLLGVAADGAWLAISLEMALGRRSDATCKLRSCS